MNYTDFYEENRIRHALLRCGNDCFTDRELTENLTLTQQVNSADTWCFGSCCSAQLQFELYDFDSVIDLSGLAGARVEYYAGIETSQVQAEPWPDAAGAGLYVCSSVWGASAAGNELKIWDAAAEPPNQLEVLQLSVPAKALVLSGDSLYYTDDTGTVSGFTLSTEGAQVLSVPEQSPFMRSKWKSLARQNACLSWEENTLSSFCLAPGTPRGWMKTTTEYCPMGVFWVDTAQRKDSRILSVTAFDALEKLTDTPADEWLAQLSYPCTLQAFLEAFCTQFGLKLAASHTLNSQYPVDKVFEGDNTSARQVLEWIAQAAGCFARINTAGQLELGWYTDSGCTLSLSQVYERTLSEQPVQAIQKLQIRYSDEDVGILAGEGENTYVIQGNPLFYDVQAQGVSEAAQQLLERAAQVAYTPVSLSAIGNPMMIPGTRFTLLMEDNTPMAVWLMSRTLTGVRGLRDEYASVGTAMWEANDTVHHAVERLKGKTNELHRTVEETVSRLYDAETGDLTQLQQTAQSLAVSVENVQKLTQEVFPSETPPQDPVVGQFWKDVSEEPMVLRVYDGTSWVPVNDAAPALNEVMAQMRTELEQTAQSIKVTATQTGGANLLKGTAAFDLNSWTLEKTGGVQAVRPVAQTLSGGAFSIVGNTISQTVPTLKGQTYSWFARYRFSTTVTTAQAHLIVQSVITSLTKKDAWQTVKGSFTATSDQTVFSIYHDASGEFQIGDMILVRGDSVTEWQQAPNEIRTDSMQFANGVLSVGRNQDLLKTTITNSQFSVQNTHSGENVAYFGAQGAQFDRTVVRKDLTVTPKDKTQGSLTLLPQGNGHVLLVISD